MTFFALVCLWRWLNRHGRLSGLASFDPERAFQALQLALSESEVWDA